MYEVFYDFKAEPFRLSPDYRFCFNHSGYARARAYMSYAFMRAEGFVMITGRPGTGKTTLIGELIDGLAADEVATANLVCTQLQADDLLKTVAFSFGVNAGGADKAELLQHLSLRLHRWHRDGKRALLIVDEAQDLSVSAIEELRLLTNIQVDGQPLLQIFLLGQPELRDLVLSPEMEQVHQRIVAACHLEGLGPEEVEAYVLHRLGAVGWHGDPAIARAVFPLLHKFSEGVPRRINLICSRLLLHSAVEQRHQIGLEDLRVVISELQGENLAAGTRLSPEDFIEDEIASGWVGSADSGVDSHSGTPEGARLRAVGDQQSGAGAASPAGPANEPPAADTKKKVELRGLTAQPASRPEATAAPARRAVADERGDTQGAVKADHLDRQDSHDGEANSERNLSSATQRTRHASARPPASRPARSGGVAAPAGPPRWRGIAVAVVLTLFLLVAAVWAIVLGGFLPDTSVRDFAPALPPATALPGGSTSPPVQTGDDERAALTPAPAVEPTPGAADLDASVAGYPAEDTGVAAENSAGKELAGAFVPEPEPEPEPGSGSGPGSEREPETGGTLSAVEEGAHGDAGEQPAGSAPAAIREEELTLLVGFAFDSAELDNEARFVLDEIARMLQREPRMDAAITGFADGQGDAAYNIELSRQRALAAERYLLAVGIDQSRLRVEGAGVFPAEAAEGGTVDGPRSEKYRIVKIRLIPDAAT